MMMIMSTMTTMTMTMTTITMMTTTTTTMMMIIILTQSSLQSHVSVRSHDPDKNKQADKQTNKQTNRQTNKQRDKQAELLTRKDTKWISISTSYKCRKTSKRPALSNEEHGNETNFSRLEFSRTTPRISRSQSEVGELFRGALSISMAGGVLLHFA